MAYVNEQNPESAGTEVRVIGDDTTVDIEAEFRASNVQEVLDRLDRELIGLKPVKTRIYQEGVWPLPG